jgi:hypothetical protein
VGIDADNTNLAYITEAQLAPYAGKAAGIYKCPSDNYLSPKAKQAGSDRSNGGSVAMQ